MTLASGSYTLYPPPPNMVNIQEVFSGLAVACLICYDKYMFLKSKKILQKLPKARLNFFLGKLRTKIFNLSGPMAAIHHAIQTGGLNSKEVRLLGAWSEKPYSLNRPEMGPAGVGLMMSVLTLSFDDCANVLSGVSS